MSVLDAVDGSSPARECHRMGAVRTSHDSKEPGACKQLRRLASISRSPFFRFMASMRMAMWLSAVNSSDATFWRSFRKRHKNDSADAEAICEAVTRRNMRFVPTKTPEQQSCLTLHRTRHLFIRQQTAIINAIRAHLAEFGIVAPVGRRGVERLLEVVADTSDTRLPEIARACVAALGAQLPALKAQILAFDRRIMAWRTAPTRAFWLCCSCSAGMLIFNGSCRRHVRRIARDVRTGRYEPKIEKQEADLYMNPRRVR
jgi:Transposase